MAKNNKDLVSIIDTAGKEFRSRRTWAQKHVDAGRAYWSDGRCCFYSVEQLRERRARQAKLPEASAAGMHGHHGRRVSLRPTDLTPDTGGALFLTYPCPNARARSNSLRERYPVLAQPGGGMR